MKSNENLPSKFNWPPSYQWVRGSTLICFWAFNILFRAKIEAWQNDTVLRRMHYFYILFMMYYYCRKKRTCHGILLYLSILGGRFLLILKFILNVKSLESYFVFWKVLLFPLFNPLKSPNSVLGIGKHHLAVWPILGRKPLSITEWKAIGHIGTKVFASGKSPQTRWRTEADILA